ncbi:GNAT family protein [soil metagenome]
MTAPPEQWLEAPELVGDHVTIVPLETYHAAGLLEAASDESIFRWMRFARPKTIEEAEELITSFVERPGVAWAMIDERTDSVAGFTTFYDIDPVNRTVAIGSTLIGARYQRTGINTEAKLLLLTYAFEVLGAVRVVWHVDIYNTPSKIAVERIGGQREGVLRKHVMRLDGSWRDTVVFSMLDDEWPHQRVMIMKALRPL